MRSILFCALLALSCLVGCSTGSISSSSSASSGTSGTASLPSSTSTTTVNGVRRANGLPALTSDVVLQTLAREQAGLMARHLVLSHTTVPGESFAERVGRSAHRGPAAENIAEGTETIGETVDAWMLSPGHRSNLLDSRMTKYGLAEAEGNHPTRGRIRYWALVLGG